MTKELTSRQFILLSIFIMLSTKVLTIHPFVFEYAGKDAIWSITLGFLLDMIILIGVVILLQKFKDISFYGLLKKFFGTIIAKILLVFLFVFIALKALFLYQETHSFFLQILFTEISPLIYIIPAVFITGYFAIKGINTIARSMEIFSIFILIGIVICMLTAINGLNPDYILPFFENGISPMFEGFKAQIFYRGNALILLCFMGKIDFKKNFNFKFFFFNTLMALIVIIIALFFYMLYGPSALYVEFTLADLPQHDPFVTDLGRLNWLSIVVCTLALFLTSSAFLYCLANIGRWVFGFKRALIPTGIALVFITILAIINDYSLVIMQEKILREWMYACGIIMAIYVILCVIFLCVRRKKWTKP